jgi:hypothetical protein
VVTYSVPGFLVESGDFSSVDSNFESYLVFEFESYLVFESEEGVMAGIGGTVVLPFFLHISI